MNLFSSAPERQGLKRLGCVMMLVSALGGCASVYKPKNQPIDAIDTNKGYRLSTHSRPGGRGDHLVLLTFSGGGTRAAALSYGVLQELRDTPIRRRGQTIRLLDEVDAISSVSGGSFTAAYYGIFGDRIFQDYERVFLRQSIQGTLIRQLFNPKYWYRSLFTAFDRTEMAVEYYDQQIFEGKTFRDLAASQTPFIEINATDLGAGHRFSFTQSTFDLICSDLDRFSVARAVTASSAVPVAFPSVVLANHSDRCDPNQADRVKALRSRDGLTTRQRDQLKRLSSYTDRARRPYIHLVDGGITDNLGLRALTDRLSVFGLETLVNGRDPVPKDVLVVTVNAEVRPERSIEHTAENPSIIDTIDAFSNAQIALYNKESRALFLEKLEATTRQLQEKGLTIPYYFVEVSFEALKEQRLKSFFNNLPTSLELSDAEVDLLIRTGRQLLRTSPEYRRFLSDNREPDA